ncbi:MAG: hypothetical protein QW652_07820 [Candidatus Nitrosotenuis sp.]
MKAWLGSEHFVVFPNEMGAGAHLVESLSSRGCNLIGIVGYTMGPGEAVMHLCADDPELLASAIESSGHSSQRSEVLMVELDNTPGSLASALKRTSDAGVDVVHCYASALSGSQCLLVMRTSDNSKALSVLSS